MKITESRFDTNKNRFVVQIEDGKRFFLTYETVDSLSLYKGEEIPEDHLQGLLDETKLLQARDLVFSMVAKRHVSSHEIQRKLTSKNYSDELIQNTIEWFCEKKFIDDRKYLENAVKDQIRLKGYGLWRIVSNLKQKGFTTEEIRKQYELLSDSTDELERALLYAQKKWPSIRSQNLFHRKKKLSDQLRTRGFSFDTIDDVLGRLEE